MEQEKEQLKRAIRDAFGTSDFPEETPLLSENIGYNKSKYIKTVFGRQNWQEVKPVTNPKSPAWWGGQLQRRCFSVLFECSLRVLRTRPDALRDR